MSSVVYESADIDLVFYPTKAGIRSEVTLKNRPKINILKYHVKTTADCYEDKNNGYILFKKGGENQNLIYQPLVKYRNSKDSELEVTTQINIERKENGYDVEMILNQSVFNNTDYPVKLDPSFEMYLNKMPDTSIYSKFHTNSYLRHFAVVGNHPILGEGWDYIRFRINYFMTMPSSNILSTKYYFASLGNKSKCLLYQMENDWSSVNMLWKDRSIPTQKVSESNMHKANLYNYFDITSLTKKYFDDGNQIQESYGGMIKSSDNGINVIASSDHCLYSPYLVINMKEEPIYFKAQDNINKTT